MVDPPSDDPPSSGTPPSVPPSSSPPSSGPPSSNPPSSGAPSEPYVFVAQHPICADAQAERDVYAAGMEAYVSSGAADDGDGGGGPLDPGSHPVAPGEGNQLTLRRQGPVCLRDHTGQPLAGTPYVLIANGETTESHTDEQGFIGWIDTSSVTEADLYVAYAAYHLKLDTDPTDAVTHGQSMLNALGYSAGPLDGSAGPRTKSAASYYQIDRNLPVTGELDDGTVAQLLADHRLA